MTWLLCGALSNPVLEHPSAVPQRIKRGVWDGSGAACTGLIVPPAWAAGHTPHRPPHHHPPRTAEDPAAPMMASFCMRCVFMLSVPRRSLAIRIQVDVQATKTN